MLPGEYENTRLLQNVALQNQAPTFASVAPSPRLSCGCCGSDAWFGIVFVIALATALVCQCFWAEGVLLFIAILSFVLSMRFSCLYVVGAVVVVCANNYERIKKSL